ncbi:hypothetical protein JQ621_18310 [Bradyrhizobium manausense]|uniref:hypothetical protein n=1 Tax=Bradyrhizobium manausense TaxID=989370 RepID=UPI001BA4B401|nr:hypothetical protein [Bradyrhizobium manausense]MBR1089419.1 hypothetical protein [Bradyrhizobium manausense]
MDDDAGLEMRRQELRLIKMFLRITDSSKRQRIVDLAEHLAGNAAFNGPESGPAKTPTIEDYKDSSGRLE